MNAYEKALDELYGVPLDRFVAERTRLAGALRAAGDKDAAALLAKRGRPTTSAWAVNQLFRHARDAFDTMLASAARLRTGDVDAGAEHRAALAKLRQRAATLLEQGGHGATEATLRRVGATLAAIAARGGFDPDPPGALAADRDAPGFDAIAAHPVATRSSPPRLHLVPSKPHAAESAADARARAAAAKAAEAKRLAAERAEARRKEAERARAETERKRLKAALRAAETERGQGERLLESLRERMRAAEADVASADETVRDLERRLRAFEAGD